MKIIDAKVHEPLFYPDVADRPATLELFVSGSKDKPEVAETEQYGSDWLVVHYGPFCRFWHMDSLGTMEKPVPGTKDREETFHEGHFNVSEVPDEPVFPVTVTDESGHSEQYFAPVGMAKQALKDFIPGDFKGRWEIHPSFYWAKRKQIVFQLTFAPYHDPKKRV
ncbi:hypothetical protein Mbo2_090 [Rhodococcus phage Mbo2]|uniref:Uncharacterized protein n=1 Tax=Rhodococcus phage Mbo2 TaxID=2936911 RepID=A0A9E7IGZ0_9CAUD|nr:hypothetical protein Mbo2_090 [Rhodococcus phage Mbo2]